VLREAAGLAPEASSVHHWLAQMAMAAGDRALALDKLRYAEALFPGLPGPRPAPILVGALYSYSCIGQAEDVARLVAELEKVAPRESLDAGARTLLHLSLGETDEAYRWLEAAVAQVERHEAVPGYLNLFTIKTNPHANPVLEQPRFRALRARIGALD
jgi:hypothetical protein